MFAASRWGEPLAKIGGKKAQRKRTYITATDPRTRKSKCITVEGLTPHQTLKLLRDAIERGDEPAARDAEAA